MKVILTSVGIRGDMEPFVALGEILKEKGHDVTVAFPEQFRKLAKDSNLDFASLGLKYIELLESDDGKAAMGGATGFKKFSGLLNLALKQKEANKELLFRQQELIDREKPDRVIYNGKAVYPIIWGLKNRGKTIFVSPVPYVHYVKGHSHVAFNNNYGESINKLTFSLAYSGMVTTVKLSKKWLGITGKNSRREILDMLKNNRSIYTISPSLFSRPVYWDEKIKVLGYYKSNQRIEWEPDKVLKDFISRHDKILLITFGSMINPSPEEKTKIIIDILERNRIPAIINTASGGLVKPEQFDTGLIQFVPNIPYDWVFPKIYGVIHHGGSGTTHLGFKYGCPTMIIPHIIDQFVWDSIVAELGAGPGGVKISKLNTGNLEPRILDLFNNEDYKKKSELIKSRMEKENFLGEMLETITG
jgi:sterol 3beta-glucosyltransferase